MTQLEYRSLADFLKEAQPCNLVEKDVYREFYLVEAMRGEFGLVTKKDLRKMGYTPIEILKAIKEHS